MKKVVYAVTGAAGHLGNVVVKKLISMGKDVRELILPTERDINDLKSNNVYHGDVTKKETLVDFFKVSDDEELIVIHCAGIVSIASKFNQAVYDVNVTGTKNILEMCEESHVKKLVYVSSVHAITELPDNQTITELKLMDPDSVHGLYAQTKALATNIVLESKVDASVVHPSGIIGPFDYGHGHLTQLVKSYCDGSLTAGINGGYDFVDVRDVADGIISCAENGKNKECYILSNRFYLIRDLFNYLHEITKRKKINVYLSKWFITLVAPLAELYYKIRKEAPLFTKYSIYTLGSNANFSHEKATKQLKFNPRDIRQTLEDTVNWMQGAGKIKKLVRER